MGAFYANRNYIAKNLCVNRAEAVPTCKGACYLKKKLKQDQEQQSKSGTELKLKEITLFFEKVTLPNLDGTTVFISRKEKPKHYNQDFIPQDYSPSVFHPPIFFV